jgi:exodeoxyribonuclease-3
VPVKIATWNVNSLNARLPHLLRWLADVHPDIVALQETKTQDHEFPIDAIRAAGYETVFSGQKTYNGVATLSRGTLRSGDAIDISLPRLDDPQRRLLTTRHDGITVVNVYVPNGAALDSDKYPYKLNWLTHLHDYIADLLARGEQVIVLGDFNIAPTDADVHDPQAWIGQVLVSDTERAHYQALIGLGMRDCFRLFDQPPATFSWWDYRAAAFRRNMGLRIDLILCDAQLASRCRGCDIDKAPRKWERPSDHTPVVAEFL